MLGRKEATTDPPNITLLIFFLGVSSAATSELRAQPYAYVTNRADSTVSVIDTRTNTVIPPPIRVGSGPWGIAIATTPNGPRAYVANVDDDTVSVIDTKRNNEVAALPVGDGPWSIATSPDGLTAYVMNFGSGTLSVIDTATNAVKPSPIILGFNSYGGITITPDGTGAYVANILSNTVSVVNTTNGEKLCPDLLVGSNPNGIAITPDGLTAYVANSEGGELGTLSNLNSMCGVVPPAIPVGRGPLGIAITPDGLTAYVANLDDTVSVVDTTKSTVVESLTLDGHGRLGPNPIAITPDGHWAYVANWNSGTVSVINTATNTVLHPPIPVGRNPTSIAICNPAPPRPFIRGDCAGTGGVCTGGVTNAVSLLSWLFTGGPEPSCLAACDANDDSKTDLSDATYILGFCFLGTAPPPAPFPNCAPHFTCLSCEQYAPCGA